MSDDKKRDDYTIEMGSLGNNSGRDKFDALPTRSSQAPTISPSIANNPTLAILAYCGSSILMTVTNKYVMSGLNYNLNFFLLCVQVGFVHKLTLWAVY